MKIIWIIFKKEFTSYFTSPIAYIYISIFTLFTGWFFFRGFFLYGQATMREFFSLLPWIFLFFIPAVTMRTWSEEKKMDTIEILLTLPVKDYQVIMGKYFASLLLVTIAIFLTLPLYLVVSLLGSPDHGVIVCGYLGSVLLGAAYLSIGSFVSSLSENQIVAFILGVTLSFILFILGENIVLYSLPYSVSTVLHYLGLGSHFESISRGVLDSRDIVYYISIIFFFIYLNMQSLEKRKWQ
ncbi:MAG: ABC transporter [Candidatus Margulisiibacteriota bacterium]|nr:MAG: ABC transporter [Candidatus Margulisbacteria bacterium GWD2_39_127]OGI01549.1 MAG: ABC transporter [Candidatus Margulisbacteria bacterium GWF2_38_17]OGI09990.1 MAG: ABC transporter [Candidatus Margulisbacteria bacterium GWE2_39_32]PZM78244.1 MAG: ABC transporter [Candidatus Margulisiibacteriota bacterium]HAR61869.1 ABC transporter [Candidatus Margulisiibacteriota bacterium]